LEPVEVGTRFTYEANNEIPWGIRGKIIVPLILRMDRKEFERSLENLKTILEKETRRISQFFGIFGKNAGSVFSEIHV
jgi:hypothetical protein